MSLRSAIRPLWLALLVAAPLLAGCDVTADKIASWKETERGPGKIRDALRSSSVAPELRAQALAALVELGMLAEAQEDLKGASEADRKAIVHAAASPLTKLAQGAGDASTTTRVQRNAKDALFQFRDQAAPADQAAIDDALVAWTCADLAGRMTAGGNSSDKILTAVGVRAGPRLAQVIGDSSSSEPSRLEAARLLGKVGDAASREQAGSRLVEIARRQRQPQESTMQAIGLVGGDHAVAYLTQLADDSKQTAVIRQKALLALAQGGDAAALPAALRIAADHRAPGEARDAAFELAEKIGAPAVPGLVKLLDDKDDQVRWRAVEAALKAGREQAVTPVLEALAPSRSYSKEDLKSYVVHDLVLIGPTALPSLREELKSKSWPARLAAVEGMGALGKVDDAARLDALAGDATRVKGFSGAATLGAEAKAIAAELRARK